MNGECLRGPIYRPINKLKFRAFDNSRRTTNSSFRRELINKSLDNFVFHRNLLTKKLYHFPKYAGFRHTYCTEVFQVIRNIMPEIYCLIRAPLFPNVDSLLTSSLLFIFKDKSRSTEIEKEAIFFLIFAGNGFVDTKQTATG